MKSMLEPLEKDPIKISLSFAKQDDVYAFTRVGITWDSH